MTPENEKKLETIRQILPQYVDPRRLEHTVNVYRECLWFAKKFRLSEEDTYTVAAAALLHDITKHLPDEAAVSLCKKYGIALPDASAVIHQCTGAPFARELLGGQIVTDAVWSAISCHTTGKADMSDTDKVLFISDFTEAGRKYRSCQEMREYLHQECEKINRNDKTAFSHLLNDVAGRIIGFTITYLTEKHKKIDVGMILAWNAMIAET